MAVVIVVRQSHLQQPVQCQQVEQILQLVAVGQHRGLHGLAAIGLIRSAQPVRLVVQHMETPLMLEHQVDEALQHAVELPRQQRGPRRTIERVLAHPGIQRRQVDVLHRQHEAHLHLILPQAGQRERGAAIRRHRPGTHQRLFHVALDPIPAPRIQRQGLRQQTHQPVRQQRLPGLPVRHALQAPAHLLGHACRILCQRGKALASGPFQQTMQEGPGPGPPRKIMHAAAEPPRALLRIHHRQRRSFSRLHQVPLPHGIGCALLGPGIGQRRIAIRCIAFGHVPTRLPSVTSGRFHGFHVSMRGNRLMHAPVGR